MNATVFGYDVKAGDTIEFAGGEIMVVVKVTESGRVQFVTSNKAGGNIDKGTMTPKTIQGRYRDYVAVRHVDSREAYLRRTLAAQVARNGGVMLSECLFKGSDGAYRGSASYAERDGTLLHVFNLKLQHGTLWLHDGGCTQFDADRLAILAGMLK